MPVGSRTKCGSPEYDQRVSDPSISLSSIRCRYHVLSPRLHVTRAVCACACFLEVELNCMEVELNCMHSGDPKINTLRWMSEGFHLPDGTTGAASLHSELFTPLASQFRNGRTPAHEVPSPRRGSRSAMPFEPGWGDPRPTCNNRSVPFHGLVDTAEQRTPGFHHIEHVHVHVHVHISWLKRAVSRRTNWAVGHEGLYERI